MVWDFTRYRRRRSCPHEWLLIFTRYPRRRSCPHEWLWIFLSRLQIPIPNSQFPIINFPIPNPNSQFSNLYHLCCRLCPHKWLLPASVSAFINGLGFLGVTVASVPVFMNGLGFYALPAPPFVSSRMAWN